MDFLNLVSERFSCRKFSDKKVEQEKIDEIINVALKAPTGVNKQPFKIFEINGSDKIEKLKLATPFTFNAQEFLIVCADESLAYVRNFDNKNFAQIDAVIVATHIMLAIHNANLRTTWVGHFSEKVLKEQFPVLNNYIPVAIFPIGYQAQEAEINPRHFESKSKEELFEKI